MTRRFRVRLLWVAAAIAVLLLLLLIVDLSGGQEPILTRLFMRQDHTWQSIQSRGRWRVAMDPSFPPFETLDENGMPVGYDVELARRIAALWGVEAEIIALGYDSLIDAVMAGKVDSVVSALPHDPRLTRDVVFSQPYFEAGLRLVVRAGSPIAGVEQLAGSTIAAEWGSLGDMVGRRLQREDASIHLQPYDTPEEAVAALVNDPAIDALLIDQVTLRLAQGQGAAIVAVGPPLESNPYVIAMPLRATDLHTQVAQALEQLRTSGAMAELENEWFGPLPSAK